MPKVRNIIEGSISHYVDPDATHCQAAIIVRVWGGDEGGVNLTVFPDWDNDQKHGHIGVSRGLTWKTSIIHGVGKVGTWHFAEECPRLLDVEAEPAPTSAPSGE